MILKREYNRGFMLSLLLGFGLLSSAFAQSDRLEVITLHHRSAEDIIPLLQPLVGETGVVTGRSDQLVLRTTPERLSEIRTLLTQLDQPPRRLLISVQQLSHSDAERRSGGLAGSLQYRDHGPQSSDGASVRLDAELEHRGTRRGDTILQQLQVTDGSEAFIQVGKDIPQVESIEIIDPAYPDRGSWTRYHRLQRRAVTTGFYVRPRVHGDWVTLEIAPQREQQDPRGGGRIDTQAVATTVTGPLGEWLELSSVHTHQRSTDQAVIRSTAMADDSEGRILVKVEVLP